MNDLLVFLGTTGGLVLGAVCVWAYDSKIPQRIKRVLVVLLMSPYIYALFTAAMNWKIALGLAFPIGIVGLKWFARLRAARMPKKEEEEE